MASTKPLSKAALAALAELGIDSAQAEKLRDQNARKERVSAQQENLAPTFTAAVAAILDSGVETHDSVNGKAWNGASVSGIKVTCGGVEYLVQVTLKDVAKSAALKPADDKTPATV